MELRRCAAARSVAESPETMAAEMAARWCAANDRGDARPVPYTVVSLVVGRVAVRCARVRG